MNGSVNLTLEEFRELAATRRVIPLVRTLLADAETPLSVYRKLADNRPGTFLFESAENGKSWARWSYIGVAAPVALTVRDGQPRWLGTPPEGLPTEGNPLEVLNRSLEILHTEPLPGVPPLTGGFVGYMGYDSVRWLERIPELTVDDLQVPELVMLFATDLAALDHHSGTISLIANAVNWDDSTERVEEAYADAIARLDEMTATLCQNVEPSISTFTKVKPEIRRKRTQEDYFAAVEVAKEAIRAGEAFQVVLSQRFEVDTDADALDVYRILRTTNPSPYMYLLRIQVDENVFDIVGSSPEALVTVRDGKVTAHPIAGTRPRGVDEEEDRFHEKDLLNDEKERAEHLMLVDLGRNDLGRVCKPGTVKVTDFFTIERYSHVMHIVSTVVGTLRDDKSALDATLAFFPAGTLSGAPKPRAMELIEELEPTRRGIYGGVVGYLDFAGEADTAIAIRTAVLKNGVAYVQAGAGIVADSVPLTEDVECQNKAATALAAVATASTLKAPGKPHE